MKERNTAKGVSSSAKQVQTEFSFPVATSRIQQYLQNGGRKAGES
jgi:hypothetical protein